MLCLKKVHDDSPGSGWGGLETSRPVTHLVYPSTDWGKDCVPPYRRAFFLNKCTSGVPQPFNRFCCSRDATNCAKQSIPPHGDTQVFPPFCYQYVIQCLASLTFQPRASRAGRVHFESFQAQHTCRPTAYPHKGVHIFTSSKYHRFWSSTIA